MLLEAAVTLCLTNATDAAVFGLVRDGRFKTTSAKLAGTSLTYREPLAETAFPSVAAGETGCATFDAVTLARPRLVLWTRARLPDPAGGPPPARKGDATCRPAADPQAGQRLTFVYRKTPLGQRKCKESR